MRKYVFILIVLAVIVISSLILFNRPLFIANPEHMSKFFNLSSETHKSFIVLDAMYSQGKNGAIGMGTDNYWLRIVDNPHDIGQAILNAGGYETDSIYSIYIIRGDIEGTLTVHKYDDKGHLRFNKME